jgi:hypothetical protein
MNGMVVTNVKNKVVAIGDNWFESGLINIASAASVKAGTVLKRDTNGKFAPVVKTETTPGTHGVPADGGGWQTEPTDPVPGDIPVAVMPYDLENLGNADADYGFRAIVSGRVRADMLTINGNSTTAAQNDLLRSCGIIPVKVTDLSQLDNQ